MVANRRNYMVQHGASIMLCRNLPHTYVYIYIYIYIIYPHYARFHTFHISMGIFGKLLDLPFKMFCLRVSASGSGSPVVHQGHRDDISISHWPMVSPPIAGKKLENWWKTNWKSLKNHDSSWFFGMYTMNFLTMILQKCSWTLFFVTSISNDPDFNHDLLGGHFNQENDDQQVDSGIPHLKRKKPFRRI